MSSPSSAARTVSTNQMASGPTSLATTRASSARPAMISATRRFAPESAGESIAAAANREATSGSSAASWRARSTMASAEAGSMSSSWAGSTRWRISTSAKSASRTPPEAAERNTTSAGVSCPVRIRAIPLVFSSTTPSGSRASSSQRPVQKSRVVRRLSVLRCRSRDRGVPVMESSRAMASSSRPARAS